MHAPTICTIVAKNYISQARALTESFLEQHPDGRVFVLLADERDDYFDASAERFTTIEARDLAIPDFLQMAFRYTVVEFNTAVKPFLLEYLFEHYELQTLCYFDPDIYFYQPLSELYALLETHAVVLTPHLLHPLDDTHMPDEPYILRAGVYNLGFIGLARGPELAKLLQWWQQKLLKDCVVDASRGLFVDQRWIDLVPGMFERVAILRDPGHNAAYWNLKHRDVRFVDGEWRVNDRPLVFYHFSGIPMSDINAISRHQDRFTLADLPGLAPLFAGYRDRLLANGFAETRAWPYAYGTFDNAVAIPDAARHLWRNVDDGVRWPRPFETNGDQSFFNWLNQDVLEGARQPLITNLAMELYRGRWDLQQAFPDVLGVHRQAFVNWFTHKAEEQYKLDLVFVDPIQSSLLAFKRAAKPPAPPAAPAKPKATQQATPAAPRRPQVQQRRMYYALRGSLRRLGLSEPLKHALGPQRVHGLYSRFTVARRASIAEAPLLGKPTLRRRVYYAVRNPLRQLGLHDLARRVLGDGTVVRIYDRMVAEYNLPPEAMTRRAGLAALPPQKPIAKAVDVQPALPTRGINVIGYLRAETGMGEVPRAVARALAELNYPVALTDLSTANWARADDTSVLHLPQGNPYACNLVCVNADMLPLVVQHLGMEFFARKRTIGFWHWETAHFPEQWHDRFSFLDEIWVDSGFVQQTLALVSPVPIVNVRLPINALHAKQHTRAELGLPDDRTMFLFSFDMRSFIERKNPHGLVEAYRRAFGADGDRTILVIKATNTDAFPAETEQLRCDLASVGGVLIDRYMDRAELSSLFAECDCYVSLHRGEGFGLTMAEAMALGKPVIATAYSGNLEFMTPANSYLVGCRVTAIDGDYGPYVRGDEWADPDLDHAAALLRRVASEPAEAGLIGARAAEDMQRFFSSRAVGERIVKRLDQIYQMRAPTA